MSVTLVGLLDVWQPNKRIRRAERLSSTAQNELANLVTLLLGITIGSTMYADAFISLNTVKILALGLFAFIFDTAGGVLFAKFLNLFVKGKIQSNGWSSWNIRIPHVSEGGTENSKRRRSDKLCIDAGDRRKRGRANRINHRRKCDLSAIVPRKGFKWKHLNLGFKMMVYGMGTTFTILVIFYFLIKILLNYFLEKNKTVGTILFI